MIARIAASALWVAIAVSLSSPAFAQQSVQVEQAWSRAAMAGRNGAVFLTVKVTSPDRLIAAASPASDRTELHESLMDNGVMKMREVRGLDVTADKPLTLAPGGYHIMLMGLKQPLNEGDSIPVALTFEKAGVVGATAVVGKAGAPAMHGTHGTTGHK